MMVRDDRFKRYQDAGVDFLETGRAWAEQLLGELAKAGEQTQRQAQGTVGDIVGGGRRGTDQLIDLIRTEISNQFSQLGLATKADVAAVESRLMRRMDAPPATPPAAGRGGTAKRGTAKRGTAKRNTSKSATAKRGTAKRNTSKSATAKRGTAKRGTAKRGTAKRATARTPAKKATARTSARPGTVKAPAAPSKQTPPRSGRSTPRHS